VTVRRRGVAGPHGRLAIEEVGPPDAPAVVLAHGVGSSARFVREAFGAPLLAWGARLVAFDLRGHGGSDAAPAVADHALDAHAADLAAVVDDLDDPPAVVGGVSLGGHAAVRAVAAGRVRAGVTLACLPAWTGSAVRGSGPHAVVAGEVARVGIDGVLARLRQDTEMPCWLRATLVTDYPRHDPDSLRAALLALDGGDAPTTDELARLPTPLAVVGWADDPGHPLEVARTWASLAPRGRLHRTALGDLERGLTRLGDAAVAALRGLGVASALAGQALARGEHRLGDP
jgi:pimeloyl-ACP methyl ester carboxylesterase